MAKIEGAWSPIGGIVTPIDDGEYGEPVRSRESPRPRNGLPIVPYEYQGNRLRRNCPTCELWLSCGGLFCRTPIRREDSGTGSGGRRRRPSHARPQRHHGPAFADPWRDEDLPCSVPREWLTSIREGM